MQKFVAWLSVLSVLTSCSSTSSDLERKTQSTAKTATFAENYQEIYRRVSTTARNCNSGNINAYASFDVDAQLYNELGYGEVTFSLSNLGTRNYYWKAKIEKQGAGSKVTVHAGNTLNARQLSSNVLRWAGGDEGC